MVLILVVEVVVIDDGDDAVVVTDGDDGEDNGDDEKKSSHFSSHNFLFPLKRNKLLKKTSCLSSVTSGFRSRSYWDFFFLVITLRIINPRLNQHYPTYDSFCSYDNYYYVNW